MIVVLAISLFVAVLAGGYALLGPERLERWADRWFGL